MLVAGLTQSAQTIECMSGRNHLDFAFDPGVRSACIMFGVDTIRARPSHCEILLLECFSLPKLTIGAPLTFGDNITAHVLHCRSRQLNPDLRFCRLHDSLIPFTRSINHK